MTAKRDIGDFSTGADGDGQLWTTSTRESLVALWGLNAGRLINVAGTNSVTADLAVSTGFTAYTDGLRGTIVPVNTNTGAATLDLGPGEKPWKRQNGDALEAGDLVAGSIQPWVFLAAEDEFRIITSTGVSNVTVQGGIHRHRSLPTRLIATVAETTSESALLSRTHQAASITSRITIGGVISRKHAAGTDDADGLTIALFVDGVEEETINDGVYSGAAQLSGFAFEHAPGDTSSHTYAIRATSTLGAAYLAGGTYMILSEFSPNA